ncbi:glucokinase [Maricaulis parjimensis]|uniref:glucokinase n=1 Tax=Maricaulis parjimensis TaxID=144023 RepID=UPI0019394F2D|nr:glucokinase [Maricaulis parjimensis]
MTDAPTYLVADIGGTNARFAIARGSVADGFELHHIRHLKNEDFDQLRDAALAYLETCRAEPPRRACFAVASPITPGRIQLTNAAWSFTPSDLAGTLGLEHILPVNDFAAQARGAPLTPSADLVLINEGTERPEAPRAVLGPGTGLGLGLLVPDGDRLRVIATEGGHAGFAPRTALEVEVFKDLAREYEFVSWERLLSGRGLLNLHRSICRIEGVEWTGDRPETITRTALKDPDSLAARVVDLFCCLLGGYAGDVAVLTGARGGVYLGGGILPKIRPLLEKSAFLDRFIDREPMSGYTRDIPIRLICSDGAALRGAAALAEQGYQ